jgi:hypothetical protein
MTELRQGDEVRVKERHLFAGQKGVLQWLSASDDGVCGVAMVDPTFKDRELILQTEVLELLPPLSGHREKGEVGTIHQWQRWKTKRSGEAT